MCGQLPSIVLTHLPLNSLSSLTRHAFSISILRATPEEFAYFSGDRHRDQAIAEGFEDVLRGWLDQAHTYELNARKRLTLRGRQGTLRGDSGRLVTPLSTTTRVMYQAASG